jgi:hypothetical protein
VRCYLASGEHQYIHCRELEKEEIPKKKRNKKKRRRRFN